MLIEHEEDKILKVLSLDIIHILQSVSVARAGDCLLPEVLSYPAYLRDKEWGNKPFSLINRRRPFCPYLSNEGQSDCVGRRKRLIETLNPASEPSPGLLFCVFNRRGRRRTRRIKIKKDSSRNQIGSYNSARRSAANLHASHRGVRRCNSTPIMGCEKERKKRELSAEGFRVRIVGTLRNSRHENQVLNKTMKIKYSCIFFELYLHLNQTIKSQTY